MKNSTKGGKLLSGLSRKNPSGTAGPPISSMAKTIGTDPTRSSVGRGHTIGGRTA